MKKIFYMIMFLLLVTTAKAQQDYTLSGYVTKAETGEIIAGALVSADGLSEPVKTDQDGHFELNVTRNASLRVWYPDYYEFQLILDGRKTIKVALVHKNSKIVAAYGPKVIQMSPVIEKSDYFIGSTQLESNLELIPGVQVISKSGMPGEGDYFTIRGLSSMTASTSPLLVVNGVPYLPDMNESGIIGGFSKSILNAFHPRDIDKVKVLKGAEAAEWGSMGSNGVILIETDKATDMETKVEFSSQSGIVRNVSRMPVLGVNDYKSYVGNVALTRYDDMGNALSLFPYLIDDPNYYYKYLYNNSTDWQDLIYADAMSQDHVLKIKGGDAIAKYDVSIGYNNIGGQIRGTDYSKYYARLNADVNLSRKVSLFSSILMAYHNYQLKEQGMLDATNPMLAAMKKGPLYAPYQKDMYNNLLPDLAVIRDEDNNLIENNRVSNPLALVESMDADEHGYDVHLNYGINFQLNKNLSVRGLSGIYYFLSRQNVFVPGITNRTIMPLNQELAINSVRSAEGTTFNQFYQLGMDYSGKVESDHSFRIHVDGRVIHNSAEYDAGTGYNTANDFYKTLNNVVSSSRSYFGYNDVWNYLGLNANVNYSWKQQLLADFSLMADASSATGPDAPQFALYPALNVSWLTKQSMLSDINWIDQLKLNLSAYQTGNSRFSSSLSKYNYISKVFREISGLVRAGIPNTEIIPERNTTFSAGLDSWLFHNKLNLTIDVYKTLNQNLIMPVTISSAYGKNYLFDNLASTQNSGIEFGLKTYIIRSKDFNWFAGVSFAANKEKVMALGGQDNLLIEMEDGSALRSKIGESLYSFYGYQTVGIFASQAEADIAGLNGNALSTFVGIPFEAGDVHFADQNYDGVIDDRDRVNLGSASPLFQGMFQTSLQYRNLELSASFRYSYGNKMYNAVRREMESMKDFSNQLVTVNRRWMFDGQQTDIPRAVYGDPMGNSRFSDRYIEDASFLKLKELTLSYHFDKLMHGLTVFAVGENLFTLTRYLGMDPETMYSYNPLMRGFDYAKVPHAVIYKFGLNVQF